MNIQKLGQMYENIQILIALKNQHLIIYAWIEFKKIKRRMGSCQSSRAQSNVSIYNSERYRPLNYEESSYQASKSLIKNRSMLHFHGFNKESTIMHDAHLGRKQMKSTFNQSPPENQYYFTQKQVQKHWGQRMLGQSKSEYQFQDSGQFEDVIFDRLSKLEENIDKMMREKKRKEDNRGYIGSPINSNKYERKMHIGSPPLYPKHKIDTATVDQKSFGKIITFNNLQQSDYKSYRIENTKNRCRESQVDIGKIKRILQNNNAEQQTFRQGIDFLNSDRRKWEQKQQGIKGIYSQQLINGENFVAQTEIKQRNLCHFIEGKADDKIFNQYKRQNKIKENSKDLTPLSSEFILQSKTQAKGLTFNSQFIKRLQRKRRDNDKNIVKQPNLKFQDSKLPYCAIDTKIVFYPSKLKNISFC